MKDRKEQFDKAPKQKIGNEVVVLGVWRNCKFHLVRLKAEREVTTLPSGEVIENAKMGSKAEDEMAAQLPERDPKCDNVEPSPEQIEANRLAIDAETARLNPGRPAPGPR